MKTPNQPRLSIAEIEREVIAETREFGRKLLEERFQELADQEGEVFPPPSTARSKADAAKRVGKHPAKG